MTYVIEHLENHNAVISPKLLRLDKIYRRAVLSPPFQLLRQPQQRETSSAFYILYSASSTFINENKALNLTGLSASLV